MAFLLSSDNPLSVQTTTLAAIDIVALALTRPKAATRIVGLPLSAHGARHLALSSMPAVSLSWCGGLLIHSKASSIESTGSPYGIW